MYRSLNADHIIQTIGQLRDRIQERFPDAGLGKVAEELKRIGTEAVTRAEWIARPLLPLRIAIGFLVALLASIILLALANVKISKMWESFADFVQAVDAGINDIVFVGIAIFFLVTLEGRIKRKRALGAIHELRALAHIIDMHQLTKDPEIILTGGPATKSSPKRTMTTFEMSRYLDYCSEMGDFNRDGKLDLVVLNASTNVSLLLGNSDGSFQRAVNSGAGVGPSAVTVSDFNGDGNSDLLIPNFVPCDWGAIHNVSMLFGKGDGSFRSPVILDFGTFIAPPALPGFLAVGDFDGDGRPDLAIISYYSTISTSISVMLGKGDGAFRQLRDWRESFLRDGGRFQRRRQVRPRGAQLERRLGVVEHLRLRRHSPGRRAHQHGPHPFLAAVAR